MSIEPPPSDLDWVQLRHDISQHRPTETAKEKMVRKIKENPFVPAGALLTAGVLSYGLWSFRQGRQKMSQTMMRARIVAQGFTLAALVGGVIMTNRANKPNN